MASLLTVTLNPAVDQTYRVPGFALNGVNRVLELQTTAGGKGINVARVYRTLGGNAMATGFCGGRNGDYLLGELAAEQIGSQFVRVAGQSRVCIKVIDPNAGTQTEINEPGPLVDSASCAALLALLRELLPGRTAVVISGSAPPGVPASLYREMITLAQEKYGVPAALDASGELLKLGIKAAPFLAKPNVHELAALEISAENITQAAQILRKRYGVQIAIVTAGAHGAAVSVSEGVWQAAPPPVRAVSAVGSGDALLAGFLWAWHQGQTVPGALRTGVAAGAANAMSYGAGICTKAQIEMLAAQTIVQQTV